MDSRLEERLRKIDDHITKLHALEHEYFLLDGTDKALLAKLTLDASGKSQAEKQAQALASSDWKHFATGLALKHADYLREKRRYELLLKAFDAEYLTMKVEGSAIVRQK